MTLDAPVAAATTGGEAAVLTLTLLGLLAGSIWLCVRLSKPRTRRRVTWVIILHPPPATDRPLCPLCEHTRVTSHTDACPECVARFRIALDRYGRADR